MEPSSLVHSHLMIATLSHPLQVLFVTLIGLAFGSFGTMLLYRLPNSESIMGRSQCTKCSKTLHWYDLVPIFSFLLLGGRCHYCKTEISWRYPFTEAITALLLVLLMVNVETESDIELILLGASVYSLILIAFYDFETQKIPDVFVMVLFVSALLYQSIISISGDPLTMRDSFIGAAIPFCFFGGLWVISKQQWIGSGDILLGVAIGILLGTKLMALTLFFAYIMGALAAIFLIAFNLAKRGTAIPFGPFLASGALLSLFVGEEFLRQYELMLF